MEVNNTTSRQEHWWFLMRQRASGTVNHEMKKKPIYMFSQIFCFLFLLYKCQKRISWWCPSRFRFRTSPCYLMVVLLPSWGKNKCRALRALKLVKELHIKVFLKKKGKFQVRSKRVNRWSDRGFQGVGAALAKGRFPQVSAGWGTAKKILSIWQHCHHWWHRKRS